MMAMLNQPLAISGVGCVGGFGCGNAAFRHALQAGFCPATALSGQHPDGQAVRAALLADSEPLDAFVPRRALRRLDHFSRLALLGGYLALTDAAVPPADYAKLGIIIASGYGAAATTFNFLDSILEDGDSCASPTSFSNSVHNAASAYLTMQLQALGPNLTVSQFEMSMTAALLNAVCWLEQGRVERVLVGGVDEHCAVLNYCYARFFGAAASPQIAPFDWQRQTAIPGEGAAFLVLSRQPADANYGYLTGVQAGHLDHACAQTLSVPEVDVQILGADGQHDSARRYASWLDRDRHRPTLSCSPCYGSLPVGQAFDLVAAALMLRDQRYYGVAATPLPAVAKVQSIGVIKAANDGQFGQVTLATRR